MKKLWLIICILAVANILAIGGFIGWLGATDRLSKDRLWKIKELLSPTVAEQKVIDDKAAAEAEDKAKIVADAKRRAGEPESASERIASNRENQEILDQQLARMREEARQLQTLIDQRKADLERQVARFDADREAFRKERAEWEQLAGDEQFQQAIGVLETQKPADAMKVLRSILEAPAGPQAADAAQGRRKQEEIVIRYLANMNDKVRSKIMAEFVKADEKLAADLLEQLRTRGTAGSSTSAPVASGSNGP